MKFAIIDCETTGFPIRPKKFNTWFSPKTISKYNSSRTVSISFKICNLDNNVITFNETEDYIIKPDGFIISNDNFHGITTDHALEHGITMADFSAIFNEKFSEVDNIIAHNVLFDVNVIQSEFYRGNFTRSIDIMNGINKICSGDKTIAIVGLINKGGYPKMPRLEELYEYVFNSNLLNAHQSRFDVENLFKCIYELHNNNTVSFFT
jgi:DNA polymerase III epsilon subunit-like protein|uniref:Exonuclease domain-containing protein n=1 Tax=viral metagenome TaxID=1070528 RepID=A0A6C0BYH7_9ZZZZ